MNKIWYLEYEEKFLNHKENDVVFTKPIQVIRYLNKNSNAKRNRLWSQLQRKPAEMVRWKHATVPKISILLSCLYILHEGALRFTNPIVLVTAISSTKIITKDLLVHCLVWKKLYRRINSQNNSGFRTRRASMLKDPALLFQKIGFLYVCALGDNLTLRTTKSIN